MSEESVIRIVKDFSAFNSVGIAGNFDNFAVMNQTVNNCVCDDSETRLQFFSEAKGIYKS